MPRFSRPKDCKNCPYKSRAFSHLTPEELLKLQQNCLIIKFKKGEIIAKQGTIASHSLYVSKGLIKLYVEGQNRNIIIKLISEGNFIGIHSLFSELNTYNFSVAAVENSNICMIPKEIFYQQAQKNQNFLFEITKNISKCTNTIFEKLLSLSEKSARGRLIETLLYFSEEIYKSKTFVLPITRKELAELCSISTENAVRILSELKKEELIDIDGKKITIKQPALLAKLSAIS